MIQIFPWSNLLETGIDDIDQQHRHLVGLLNELAQHYVDGKGLRATRRILSELGDYAVYHFETEEGIWHASLPAEAVESHEASHQVFREKVDGFRSTQADTPGLQQELLGFLTEWLAFHILDTDRGMAYVVLAMRNGMTLEQARTAANRRKRGKDGRLASTIMSLYRCMTTQTLGLMREREAHLRKLNALHDQEQTWLREELLRAQQIGHIGSWKLDLASGELEWSPETCRILGRGQHGAISQDCFWESVHPEDRERVEADWQAALAGGLYETEHRVVRGDEVVWVRSRADFDRDPFSGRRVAIGTVQDITDECRLRQQERSLQEFKTAVQQMADGLIFTRMDGSIRFVNPAWARMHGWTEQEVTDRHLSIFHTPEQMHRDVAPAIETLLNEGRITVRLGHLRRDGSEFFTRMSASLARDSAGQAFCMIGIARDITDEVEREEREHFEQRFRTLVAEVSALFLRALSDQDFDHAMDQTLKELGELFEVDRTFLFLLSEDGESWSNTHEWCASGVKAQKHRLQHEPLDATPWWLDRLRHNRPVLIDSVAKLPPEASAERELLQAQSILSLLSLPTRDATGQLTGFIGFDSVRRERAWHEEQVKMLQVVADTVASALARRAVSRKLAENRQHLLRAQQVARIGSWKLDLLTGHLEWSPETYRLFGVEPGTPMDLNSFLDHVYPEDRRRVESAWAAALDGAPYDIEHRTLNSHGTTWVREVAEFRHRQGGGPTTAVGTVQDITERKKHEQQLEILAFMDPLTNLANHHAFAQELEERMEHATNSPLETCVFLIDVDGLGQINTSMGMPAGDEVLRIIGQRLTDFAGTAGHVGRLGGDQYALAIHDCGEIRCVAERVQQIQKVIGQAIQLGGDVIRVSACIGSVRNRGNAVRHAGVLLRMADQAIYQAKLGGRNQHVDFDLSQYFSDRSRQDDLADIRKGLRESQFTLHYQPQVDMLTGEVSGFEALLRWQHPERGLLGPEAVIPYIEDHPLIVEVGDWVIDAALAQLLEWQRGGFDTAISVNVASNQLEHPDFLDRLASRMAACASLKPAQLALEILETGPLLDISAAVKTFERIRDIGVVISLDDFGTGHSSLQTLHALAPDSLKIDRSFILGMLRDNQSLHIVQAILDLSSRFGLEVIAEGIETPELGRELIRLGCRQAQGHAIGMPMPAGQVLEWLAQWRSRPPSWLGVKQEPRINGATSAN